MCSRRQPTATAVAVTAKESFKSKESGNIGIFRKRKGSIPRFQDSLDKRIPRKKGDKHMKKQRMIELAVKVIVAALTAFLTAISTTSCMGHGPF